MNPFKLTITLLEKNNEQTGISFFAPDVLTAKKMAHSLLCDFKKENGALTASLWMKSRCKNRHQIPRKIVNFRNNLTTTQVAEITCPRCFY